MSRYGTAQAYIELLQKLEPNDEVAIPFIWFKEDVEETFETKLTDSEWENIRGHYIDNDEFHETSFIVMADSVAKVKPQGEEK